MVIGYDPLALATGLAIGDRFKFNRQAFIVPVTLESPSTGRKFTFPVDPLVSLSCKNNIVTRNVATYNGKIRGTVKEKWSMTDWTIKISGLLMSDDRDTVCDYIMDLRKFVEADETCKIICPYINDNYDITRAVIEGCDFPFTQGEENQQFTLSMVSDDERISLLTD